MSPALTTLVSFNGTNGAGPFGSLITDANGDLFGTTRSGGTNNVGTVFEIVKTAAGYSSTPITLVTFDGSNGANPFDSLIADANGNLFGTTYLGGANNAGTVFEIVKSAAGYSGTPITLVNFDGTNGLKPQGSLIADANGNLFGTTYGEPGVFPNPTYGTVFEIVKTGGGYSSTPTTLVNFDFSNGASPAGSLITDANGNLFGTTTLGGHGAGSVFEIVKTGAGYSSNPTTLVSFNVTDGASPQGSLLADANGNLFGTTYAGGTYNAGTVFEIVKTAAGYSSTPITLVNFDTINGSFPTGSLIADANGNLFGTTYVGNQFDMTHAEAGTVFEIVKSAAGYSSTPITLVNFNNGNGANPYGDLLADANGNLFGTTSGGGTNGAGTVFEITGSGFGLVVPPPANAAPPAGTTADMIMRHNSGQYAIYDIRNNVILANYLLVSVGTEWQFAGLGGFQVGDTSDMMLRNASTGTFQVYNISNNNITNSALLGTVGLNWDIAGFGNFSSRGETDMILRDGNTGAFLAYDISNNQITSTAPLGTVGLEWHVSGINNHGSASDMVLRNSNTGALLLYAISNNQITGTFSLGAVGLNWQVVGFGNFSSVPGEGDMLMRNLDTGNFLDYNIRNNQVAGVFGLGAVGLDWEVAGFGPFSGPGASDMMLRNINTDQFEVYNIANNRITGFAALHTIGFDPQGGITIGSDWQVGGFAAVPPTGATGSSDNSSTAHLVQAMAGFGGGSGAAESLNTVPLSAGTSQQTFLTAPQHT
jgi:uncharacterized repeat protein (TIGR03803 family)